MSNLEQIRLQLAQQAITAQSVCYWCGANGNLVKNTKDKVIECEDTVVCILRCRQTINYKTWTRREGPMPRFGYFDGN